MIVCRFKPIEKWPSKPTSGYMRQYSRFKASWQNTLDQLKRELNYLKAKNISIEAVKARRQADISADVDHGT